MKKFHPEPVKSYYCPKCGELMCKIYPWSGWNVTGNITPCKKCLNKVTDAKSLGLGMSKS